MAENKVHPACHRCGSKEVLRDAYAVWDNDLQDWVLHSTYDDYRCDSCDEEFGSPRWVKEDGSDA